MDGDEPANIRAAMDAAWRDHQHTRDQTWKALQAEFVIAAGLIGVNWELQNSAFAVFSCVLLSFVALCGIQITLRHRNKVELLKFEHILNCEEALGLHRPSLISKVKMPKEIRFFWDVVNPWKHNTALFILRMHCAVFLFAVLFLVTRVVAD